MTEYQRGVSDTTARLKAELLAADLMSEKMETWQDCIDAVREAINRVMK